MTSELHERRLGEIVAALLAAGVRRVLDLGCGDGDLVVRLLDCPQIAQITALDPDRGALLRLRARLALLSPDQASRVQIVQGSVLDAGAELAGYDAAVLVEVIEHLPPDRLDRLAMAVLGRIGAPLVLVSTPNAEANPALGVPAHRFRHPDHRFEWGRARFARWAGDVAARHGYGFALVPVGPEFPGVGAASQMAIFRRRDSAT